MRCPQAAAYSAHCGELQVAVSTAGFPGARRLVARPHGATYRCFGPPQGQPMPAARVPCTGQPTGGQLTDTCTVPAAAPYSPCVTKCSRGQVAVIFRG